MELKFPKELQTLKQWVCWKGIPDESRPGKIKKVPINPYTGGQAQSNNPQTWSDYETALRERGKYSGIGFMFGNGYFGVDIDDVRAEIEEYKMGVADNIVSEFIYALQSYAEYSVSGNGLHIICRGTLPKNGRRRKNVEMYSEGRFFIMTGNRASEYTDIAECSESIKALHEKYIGGGCEPTAGVILSQPVGLSESEIIEIAKRSKQGQIFTDLYNGNWSTYFTSQSEADMSFCNMLAFYCRKDEEMMDRIFRSSGLMRDKWDRKQAGSTYGRLTISKAARHCNAVYEPKPQYSISIGMTKPEKPKLYTFDDTGNAERFTDYFKNSIRYSFVNKCWFWWDGRRWCVDNTGVVRRLADEVVENMRGELGNYIDNVPDDMDTEEMEERFMKHLKSCRSNKSKITMIKESEHRVSITPQQFDLHTDQLNTVNGILNLRTGELINHDSEQFITKITNVEYTEKSDCPLWKEFLNDIFDGNQELIRYVQTAIGYSLTGSTQEQCAFFCYGNGRNGKSTFLDIISYILGDYAANMQPETIMVRSMNNGTSDIARLKGARFVTTVEPNEGMRLNEGILKQMTGGDKITAAKKYENEFEFTPEFKIWMGANHKPIIRGTDDGIWRRMKIIPFTIQIPEEKVDKNLRNKLIKEAPAILNWMVEGCLLWGREGLKDPKVIQEAVKEYKSEMDVLESFLEDCTEKGAGKESSRDLYNVYCQWARENNEYIMPKRKFGIEMGKKVERRKSGSYVYYYGISILKEYLPYKLRFA